MRIALVAEDYYPQVGGVPEHVHHFACELVRRGHSVSVITSNMGSDRSRDEAFVQRLGTSVVTYANGGVSRITVGFRLERRLEQVFRAGRYDLVHVHGALAPTFGLAAPRAAWRAGIPVVGTFHSWFPRSAGYRLFRRPLQRMLDRFAARIAVSEPVVRALSRYFRAHWEIIPNGVDVEYFRPNGRRASDPSACPPRLLFLGRLEPRNGLDTIIEAMPRILARYPHSELTVVGDGPWRRLYEREARPLGAAVQFVGEVLRERPGYYGESDLYLCPVTRSSFGVTLLEAMACATPIVASDITGVRELVNGGGEAVLMPMQQPDAWADAAIELLAKPSVRREMGKAGREKALQFAWPRVADRIIDLQTRVVSA